MTLNTPLGERTLDASERLFFRKAMRRMSTQLIEYDSGDSLETGVPIFDAFTGYEQLVALDCVRGCLFEACEANADEAYLEATVGAIIAFVRREVSQELEIEGQIAIHTRVVPNTRWRMLLSRIFKPYGWRIKDSSSLRDWHTILDLFHNRILHNNGYLFDNSSEIDGIAAVSELALPTSFDCTHDYHAETTGTEMLSLIRRLMA